MKYKNIFKMSSTYIIYMYQYVTVQNYICQPYDL